MEKEMNLKMNKWSLCLCSCRGRHHSGTDERANEGSAIQEKCYAPRFLQIPPDLTVEEGRFCRIDFKVNDPLIHTQTRTDTHTHACTFSIFLIDLHPHSYKVTDPLIWQRLCAPANVNKSKTPFSDFSLQVGGLPTPDVCWYLDGKAIRPDDYHKMLVCEKGMHSFIIEIVTVHHAGVYECVARNRAGESRFTMRLDVIGKNEISYFLKAKNIYIYKMNHSSVQWRSWLIS